MYKVLISCAGLGSRVTQHSFGFNKSLISIDKKTVITHIIENIDNDVDIVICLGYKSDTLKEYLDVAHNDRNITYVYVDDYESVKSGLGYSINKAKELLQCPFVFISNDSIITTKIKEPIENYVYYSNKLNDTNEIDNYRTINTYPFNINEKKESKSKAYVGVCGVKDFEDFWKYNDESITLNKQTIGETYSLNKMSNVKTYECEWYDTGNEEQLLLTKKSFNTNDNIHVLDKNEECIWFTKDRVIKYHKDINFIKDRVNRVSSLESFVPSIISHTNNFYSYSKFYGNVLSSTNDMKYIKNLYSYLDDFWKPINININLFQKECMSFYKDKTYDRVKKYLKENPNDDVNNINGIMCPPILDTLDSIDWVYLSKGVPVRFHGDLHFENILYNRDSYKLIDWRQSFGTLQECGDVYYDLAKLKHGFIVSHNVVDKNRFFVSDKLISIEEEWYKDESIKILDEYVESKGYDKNKVNILTYLIYLNVAILHHKPYDKFLFMLGKFLINGGVL